MTIPGGVIFKVYLRLRDLIRHPRFFDDRMPAGRVRARLDRFRRWCGPCVWAVLWECECRGDRPREDLARLRRHA